MTMTRPPLSRLQALVASLGGRPVPTRPTLAVFIDSDGVSPKDAEKVLDHLADDGRITVLRSFGNFTGRAADGWAKLIRNRGLVARHLPSLIPGKNASDIALAIDAIELLLTVEIDTFVLVTSDADFTPLACRLREAGKRVVAYGQGSTPESLLRACAAFHDIRRLGSPNSAQAPPAIFWSLQPSDAAAAVLSALEDLSRDNGPVLLSALANHLAHLQPGFDTRIYSRRTLSELIRALPGVSLVHEGHQRFAIRKRDPS